MPSQDQKIKGGINKGNKELNLRIGDVLLLGSASNGNPDPERFVGETPSEQETFAQAALPPRNLKE